ncbi:MAG: 5-amino-6-(D-ribitylamino)uracil--L-tyrosine 4-hydroxyphenyl transferase CofH [Alphaproteobacteria bacterium]
MDHSLDEIIAAAAGGARLYADEALVLADTSAEDLIPLTAAAATLRDAHWGDKISYSRKVFIPLTHLCRDVCHYCTFAKPPKKGEAVFMTPDQVLEAARAGAAQGCKEALFTLGDKPELRYRAAREMLAELGYATTLEYLAAMAKLVFEETGIIPHLNPGLMTDEDFGALRSVSASMGIMVESLSERLTEKGMPHYGSPDKRPMARIKTLEAAGRAAVPFTTGILIGIGETRVERIEALLEIRRVHEAYGHIQEVIVQNFRAKPDTKMRDWPEPDLDDLAWTIAVARLILGGQMSVQAPPNLSPGGLVRLVAAGVNDWGGVSPVTPDFVNPEAPWPHLQRLADETAAAGKLLVERLTVYPSYALDAARWIDAKLAPAVRRAMDGQGYARTDGFVTGKSPDAPKEDLELLAARKAPIVGSRLARILDKPFADRMLSEDDAEELFEARGDAFSAVAAAADALRQEVSGDTLTYVVNRNINYTNVCYFKCQFCAFSKGKLTENLRGQPYVLDLDEIGRRTAEAWDRGATEVCLQGGIHPAYTGKTYLDILQAVKAAAPDIHVHAFTPLEVKQGAETLGMPIQEFLLMLKEAGLGTLPGTAAEILDDEVRATLCPDKLNTAEWFGVMRAAHGIGLRSTATIMFGHMESYKHWARHLLRLRHAQSESGGFSELVPLPFVAEEAPIYLKGLARMGPTFREAILMHSVARLALFPWFSNIQASWVKLGSEGVAAALKAGANDIGGTLMNESITRAAGAAHGEEMPPHAMEAIAYGIGRPIRQRSTLYGFPTESQQQRARQAAPLAPIVNRAAKEYERA